MPMLKAATDSICGDDEPCRSSRDRCVRCKAVEALSADDWYLIQFFNRVGSQFINQTPMGDKDGKAVLTPRLEGYAAALRIYGYPRQEWPWLADGALLLHRLMHGQERLSQRALCAVPLEDFLGD